MRKLKGRNLLDFPCSYTIIDLETTGLSPQWDSIIELSALKIKENKIVDSYSTLVHTPNVVINSFISSLTGITQEMIDNAPEISIELPKFLNFINDDIIIGHNVNFDINFLYDKAEFYLGQAFSNDYVDTMRISRKLYPDEPHHRLQDLACKFGLDYTNAHRAERDCRLTYEIYELLKAEIIKTYDSISNFTTTVKKSHSSVKASDIHADNTSFDSSHPLYNKVCVFTGALEKMLRKDAMQIVVNLGGINGDNVTSKTNYLILGNSDYCKTIKDGKSSKQKKAEKLKAEGQDIAILPENVFYDMIADELVIEPIIEEKQTCSVDKLPELKGLVLSDEEVAAYIKIIDILSKSVDISKIRIEQRTSSYTTLVYGEYNDFLRFKITKRTKWISIRLTSTDRQNNKDNPLFSAQEKKSQFHWKASISSIEEISLFKEFMISSCLNYN